jgi:hypothetical protein
VGSINTLFTSGSPSEKGIEHMISSTQANALEQLSFTIHTQILKDNGNTINDTHALALQSLHHLLSNMVNGDDLTLHGRWAFSLPIGMGKTTAVVAFLCAAYQLGFLKPMNSPLSLTITAARLDQLFDFERMLMDNGIPKAGLRSLVSVIHDNPTHAKRESDEDKHVPVLLIAHSRIRQVYRRKEGFLVDDLSYFLKYQEGRRDLVVWDEACQVAESVSILLQDFRQAVDCLNAFKPEATDLQSWLSQKMAELEAQRGSLVPDKDMLVREGEGIVMFSDEDKAKADTYYKIVAHLPRLLPSAREILLKVLELFRYTMRIIPASQAGIASYSLVIPNVMDNFLSLDAGFVHNQLAQADTTLRNPEDELPMLRDLKRVYGVGLADLKDCSAHTILHWNRGAGKDVVAKDLDSYLKDTVTNGNLIVEVLAQAKQFQQQRHAVILWTHKQHCGKDLGRLLKKACIKYKLNMQSSALTISTYGQHDSRNDLKSYTVAIHVGIQERNLPDLSGAVFGYKRNMDVALPKAYLLEGKLQDKALTFMQSTGRGPCREVIDGRSKTQTSLVIYKEDAKGLLTKYIQKCFPGSTIRPLEVLTVETKETSDSSVVLEVATSYLMAHRVKISSRTLKLKAQAIEIPPSTWKRIVKTAAKQAGYRWTGQSLEPFFPEDTVAA